MLKIACVCPTRDRPEDLVRMADSLIATSKNADVLCYVDDDQLHLYLHHSDWNEKYQGRVRFHVDKQVGPVHSCNKLIETFREYDIYGLITDDSEFTSPQWDEYVSDMFESFPGRIGLVSPAHDDGPYVNFPFVSKEWIEIIGWFSCPTMFHFMWDTLAELLGEASRIEYPSPEQFRILHHKRMVEFPHDYHVDAVAFLDWCITSRRAQVIKLRQAIAWRKEHPV